MALKRTFTDPVPQLQESNYRSKGIDTFHGQARFTGRQAIEVAGERLAAPFVLLASGAEPVKLRIPGEEHLVMNEDFLSLEKLSPRIAFVGGGYIAAEFAQIAAQSGVKVTVLQHGTRMLKAFDKDLVGWLMTKFRSLGIDVQTGTSVERIERLADGFRVGASRQGQKQSVEADLVVHAAGRAPALSGLNLEAADVELQGDV
jgi:glutathione reductase (NADPH)